MSSAQFDRVTARLAKVMRRRRLERGFTQEHMAMLTQITTRHYQKIESGDQNPTLRYLLLIAAAFKISLAQLFEELNA